MRKIQLNRKLHYFLQMLAILVLNIAGIFLMSFAGVRSLSTSLVFAIGTAVLVTTISEVCVDEIK